MKPNTKLTALAAAASLATLLVACGSGGGNTDTAGIGGSGITSTGTITGFGSVFVNGVRFETTNSSFDIEGMDGTQDDLAIGMVVQVNGTINSDGVTGTATHIIFDDELQGSVTKFELAANGLTATFNVLGISVLIDSKTTYFDDDGGAISINTISNGNMVELSGFFDATNTLIASRIERKENELDPEGRNKVEIKGTITNPDPDPDPNTFILTNASTIGIMVDTSTITMTPFKNGDFVEVEGTYDDNTITITATKIELEEFEYGDNDELEIEGFVTDYVSDSNFKVNGIIVDASHAEMEPRNMQITNDLQVEVEGRYVNNVLVAEEVKMRGGDVEVSAYIFAIDETNNSFTVEPANGQTLIIQTGTETTFKDYSGSSSSRRIKGLSAGDFVEIEGYKNENGIFASEVELSDPDDIEVQGIISSFTGTTITILGLDFETNDSTQFESDDHSITSLNALKERVNNGANILVEIELSDSSTNIIRKIEIED